MPEKIYNVLFLCTGNSARSVLGEVLLNHVGEGRFKAYSAGSTPRGSIHPMTLETLRRAGLSTDGLRSKSWEEFAGPDAPRMDFVFTVCDNAAGGDLPDLARPADDRPLGVEDPAAVSGPEFKQQAAFEDALRFLRNRIAAFVNLPLASIDRLSLTSKLKGIGAMDGSTSKSGNAA